MSLRAAGSLGEASPRKGTRLFYMSSTCHPAVLVSCDTIFLTNLQPRKCGDMACIRGPLGACVATYHNVDDKCCCNAKQKPNGLTRPRIGIFGQDSRLVSISPTLGTAPRLGTCLRSQTQVQCMKR